MRSVGYRQRKIERQKEAKYKMDDVWLSVRSSQGEWKIQYSLHTYNLFIIINYYTFKYLDFFYFTPDFF